MDKSSKLNERLALIANLSVVVGIADLDPVDRRVFVATFREWENSHHQYERGLYSEEEYRGRVNRWRGAMSNPGQREVWAAARETFAPSFRVEIDRIVAEVGG